MGQLKTELINKDLGAEASPEKVAAVIAAQVETNHTHKKLPVQMQLQEQKEPHEGGADLLGIDPAMQLAEDSQRRLSLEATQALSAEVMLSQPCQLLLLSQLHSHVQQQQLLSSQAIVEKQQQQLLQQKQQME